MRMNIIIHRCKRQPRLTLFLEVPCQIKHLLHRHLQALGQIHLPKDQELHSSHQSHAHHVFRTLRDIIRTHHVHACLAHKRIKCVCKNLLCRMIEPVMGVVAVAWMILVAMILEAEVLVEEVVHPQVVRVVDLALVELESEVVEEAHLQVAPVVDSLQVVVLHLAPPHHQQCRLERVVLDLNQNAGSRRRRGRPA